MASHPELSATADAPDKDAHALDGDTEQVAQLARQIRDLETARRPARQVIPSGCPAMDRCLPGGGYARGSMVELLRSASGTGGMTMALMIAKAALSEGRYLIVVDPERCFYPPAMASLGIPLERLIVLHPTDQADLIWGLDQSLRCEAIGAVIAPIRSLDDRVARRLQLATEHGGGLGILLRDLRAAQQYPSWADVQWHVRLHPSSRRSHAAQQPALARMDQKSEAASDHGATSERRWFDLELLRCSGGRCGAHVRVAIDADGEWANDAKIARGYHEHASALHLATELAQPARRRREAAG